MSAISLYLYITPGHIVSLSLSSLQMDFGRKNIYPGPFFGPVSVRIKWNETHFYSYRFILCKIINKITGQGTRLKKWRPFTRACRWKSLKTSRRRWTTASSLSRESADCFRNPSNIPNWTSKCSERKGELGYLGETVVSSASMLFQYLVSLVNDLHFFRKGRKLLFFLAESKWRNGSAVVRTSPPCELSLATSKTWWRASPTVIVTRWRAFTPISPSISPSRFDI